jgi:hypothetical protein
MIAVAVAAAWLGLVVRAERLRARSGDEMSRSARAVAEAARERPDHSFRPTPRSDRHLRMATQYAEEADFVESFCLALLIVAILLGLSLPTLAPLRRRRRTSVLGPSE